MNRYGTFRFLLAVGIVLAHIFTLTFMAFVFLGDGGTTGWDDFVKFASSVITILGLYLTVVVRFVVALQNPNFNVPKVDLLQATITSILIASSYATTVITIYFVHAGGANAIANNPTNGLTIISLIQTGMGVYAIELLKSIFPEQQ